MDNPRNRTSLDDYLTRLDAQVAHMPGAERDELRHELQQHLEVMIAAYQELGSTREEAVRAALHRFGDPVRIGRHLSHESQPTAFRRLFHGRTGWPRWVKQGVGIELLGLGLATGVASLWLNGTDSTPLLEGLMRTGLVLSACGQGLLILGGCVNWAVGILRR